MFDVEQTCTAILGNRNMTFLAWCTYLDKADTGIVKNLLHTALILIGNLNDKCRVLGKQ